MNCLSKISVGLFLALAASSASAQDFELHYLPDGQRFHLEEGTYQCFVLEEYRTLLQMDNDLHSFQLQLGVAQERIEELERISTQLTIAIDGYEEQTEILQVERDRLYDRWREENRKRHEAENRPALGSWVAWGLATAEAAVILGLVLGLVLGG